MFDSQIIYQPLNVFDATKDSNAVHILTCGLYSLVRCILHVQLTQIFPLTYIVDPKQRMAMQYWEVLAFFFIYLCN